MGNKPNLARYARKNKYDKVLAFLNEYGYRDDDDNKYDNQTAIEHATNFGHITIFDLLLNYKKEISSTAMSNKPELLRILIKHGYKLDNLYKYYMNDFSGDGYHDEDIRLHAYCMYHAVFKELVDIGPPSKSFDCVEELFFKGIILDIKELVGCVLENFPYVIDSNIKHKNGICPMNPIIFAASCNSVETMELLVKFLCKKQGQSSRYLIPEQLLKTDEFGNSIFHYCASNMSIKAWNYLLKIIGHKQKSLDLNNKGESAEKIIDKKISYRDADRERIRLIEAQYKRHDSDDEWSSHQTE